MTKKFTFVVIGCNRLHYLKNCVKSIIDFVGLSDISLVIIDNASSEKGMLEYFQELPKQIHIKRFETRIPNELHRSMNYAIKYAKKNSSLYINFIQDDYQYLYKINNLLEIVEKAFVNCPSIDQIHTNLVWKYKIKTSYVSDIINIEETKWFLIKRPPCDNGFTRISLYDKIGLYPEYTSVHGKEKGFRSGESWIASKSSHRKRLLLSTPNMGMIINCAYIRGNKRIGNYFPPIKEFYLKPFCQNEINVINENSANNKLSFIEDIVEPYGWIAGKKEKHSKNNNYSSI